MRMLELILEIKFTLTWSVFFLIHPNNEKAEVLEIHNQGAVSILHWSVIPSL